MIVQAHIDKSLMMSIMPECWHNIFIEEYKQYYINSILYWLYVDGILIWWAWIWYNPDGFVNQCIIEYIDDLYKKGVEKLSYFFIVPEFQHKWYGIKFIYDIIHKHPSIFLTCKWLSLQWFYENIGFYTSFAEWEKYLLEYKRED